MMNKIEFGTVDNSVSIEMDVKYSAKHNKVFIVGSARRNITEDYRPYIDCQEMVVSEPNVFEKFLGITFERKVQRASKKMANKLINRIIKGKTRDKEVMDEYRQRNSINPLFSRREFA